MGALMVGISYERVNCYNSPDYLRDVISAARNMLASIGGRLGQESVGNSLMCVGFNSVAAYQLVLYLAAHPLDTHTMNTDIEDRPMDRTLRVYLCAAPRNHTNPAERSLDPGGSPLRTVVKEVQTRKDGPTLAPFNTKRRLKF